MAKYSKDHCHFPERNIEFRLVSFLHVLPYPFFTISAPIKEQLLMKHLYLSTISSFKNFCL
jgi:hypothetical protein